MQDTQQNKTWQERHKWYESKTGQMQRVVELTHNGSKHHQSVPSQYKGGGSTVKGFRGCGLDRLVVGRKGDILRFLPRLLLEKGLAGMAFRPKRDKQKIVTTRCMP